MKLTKDVKVTIYEILADYKVKVDKSPFIAILKFAYEYEYFSEEEIYNELLEPLSIKACENILDRLTDMGYFEINEDYSYSLTELGEIAAEEKVFYEERHGILKVYMTDNEFVKQNIVRIEEKFDRQDKFDEDNLISIPVEIKNIKKLDRIVLETGTYIVDGIKEKCIKLKPENKILTLEALKRNSELKLLDFRLTIEENEVFLTNVILQNEFKSSYSIDSNLVKTFFNPHKIRLKRDEKIQNPKLNNTVFNDVILKNIQFTPENSIEAKKWFESLLLQKTNKYFLSDKEFLNFANNISLEFKGYESELENSISRSGLAELLASKEHFYKKMKLTTIDYLNY